jgi:hypothetical protein
MKNILAKYLHFDRSLKVHSLLAILTVGTFAVFTMLPWMAVARGETEFTDDNGVLTLATAQQAATKITVRIRVGQSGGLGVLLAKKGSSYYLITRLITKSLTYLYEIIQDILSHQFFDSLIPGSPSVTQPFN